MQKVWFALLCILSVLFMQLACAQTPTYKIGFLLDNNTAKTTALLKQLQTQITAVVGEDASIRFPADSVLVNGYDLTQAEQNYQTLLSNDTDIIIAFGIVNHALISKIKHHQKPTILFGRTNQALSKLDINRQTSGIKNFTFLVEAESYSEDLAKLKELTDFKKVGILVDQEALGFLPLEATFNDAIKNLDADYQLIPITSITEVESKLNDVDAVYVAGGFFLTPGQIRELADFFIQRKLPSFSLNGINQVENGIMASNSNGSNVEQFFRRIALTVERYVGGEPLAELPVFIDFTKKLTINFNTAEAVGVPIKYSLISDTDFVGEITNMVSQKEYDLLAVIQQALAKNRTLAASKLGIALQNQSVRSAKSELLPDVSAGVGLTHIDADTAAISNGSNPEFATAGNVQLSQLLYSEGVNANIDIQQALKQAEQENYNADELDIIFEAVNRYFTTLILKSNLKIQLKNLALTKENLNLAKQSYEIGAANKTDMLRFTSQKAQNTQALVEANNELEQSFIRLNQLLYNPADYKIDIEDMGLDHETFEDLNYVLLTEILDDPRLTEPFVAFLAQQAKQNSPELKSLAHNIDASERQIRRNGKRRFLPTVSLNAQYNRTFNRYGTGANAPIGFPQLDDNQSVALNLSVPLFNKNQFNINRQQAILQKQQLEANQQNVALSVDANVRSGVLSLVNQISNLELSKVSEETAKDSLALTQRSYQAGAVNIVQLIDAQNNYFQAQLARNNAVYNFLIAALQLQRNIGYYFLLNSDEKNLQFKQAFFDYLAATGHAKPTTPMRVNP